MASAKTNASKPAAATEDTGTDNVAETMQLKLTGADTYHCHAIRNDVIHRNEIVTVPSAIGEKLLEDTYLDASNNEHAYFTETSEEEEAAKAKRASRRTAQKPAGAEDE